MNSITTKLQLLKQQRATPATVSDSSLRDRLKRASVKRRKERPSDDELARLLGGELVDAGLIQVETRTRCRNVDSGHGETIFEDIVFPGGKLVFLDTETSGLAGGCGTLAFLVGLGEIHGDEVNVHQYLLTSYQGERALLDRVAASINEQTILVSYNGKAFDWPLLQARRGMQRLKPHEEVRQLDLLYWVRRAFAPRWRDCRLQSAEKNLLEHHRVDDIPSERIPEVWFRWLRDGDVRDLPNVIAHHRQDIVSLAELYRVIPIIYKQPSHYGADVIRIANHWIRQKKNSYARELLEAEFDQLDEKGRRLLADCCRRSQDWQQAAAIWGELAQRGCLVSARALVRNNRKILGMNRQQI